MWYLIGYACVMFAIIIIPVIAGKEWARDNPGEAFTVGLFWPLAGVFWLSYYGAMCVASVATSFGGAYSKLTSHMSCYWQHREAKKARKFDEDVAAMKEMIEVEHELRKIERQEREDYRHMHCKECGKPLNEV